MVGFASRLLSSSRSFSWIGNKPFICILGAAFDLGVPLEPGRLLGLPLPLDRGSELGLEVGSTFERWLPYELGVRLEGGLLAPGRRLPPSLPSVLGLRSALGAAVGGWTLLKSLGTAKPS